MVGFFQSLKPLAFPKSYGVCLWFAGVVKDEESNYFDGQNSHTTALIYRVLKWLWNLQSIHKPKTKLGFHDKLCTQAVQLQVQPIQLHRGVWIKLHPHEDGMLKYNNDIQFLDKRIAGGGAIKIVHITWPWVSLTHIVLGTNMKAEVMTLLHGLQLYLL